MFNIKIDGLYLCHEWMVFAIKAVKDMEGHLLMRKITYLIITFLVVSCTVLKTPCPCDAPEVIVVNGKEIMINAEVVRKDADGNGNLHIQVWLTTSDKSDFPTDLTIGNYYIRPSDLSHDAYEGSFENQVPDLSSGTISLKTALGPDWKKGEMTDVAVQLIDGKGKILFIKKDKVEIK
jgi:hypothetical protein